MTIFDIVPTCDDLMSVYTLCGFVLLSGVWFLAATLYVRYNSGEFRNIRKYTDQEIEKLVVKCAEYDGYIKATNGVINDINIVLAVQDSSMKDLKMDLTEIKADIKTLLKR